jgi:putative N-acetylmannosamine-6-phosphate epimerase
VEVVGNRIEDLIEGRHDTPQKLAFVWKCGSNSQEYGSASTRRWVRYVDRYHKMMN